MPRRDNRNIEFRRMVDGRLEREVTRPGHLPYTHRCTEDVFREVLYYLGEHGSEGQTLESIAEALDVPFTQVNVALEFLKERGILDVCGRKAYVDDGYRLTVFEHGMCEWHALLEKA